MTQPTAMKMFLPNDSGDPTPIKRSGALTILLGSNNSVYYYEGELAEDGSNIQRSSSKLIRQILTDKKRTTPAKDFVVVIKPANTSIYMDLVNIVDEMTINDIGKYALVDITHEEEKLVNN